MFIDDVMITFTAGSKMASGSKVTGPDSGGVYIRAGPKTTTALMMRARFRSRGLPTLESPAGGTTPWVLTATTNAAIDAGGTLVITYKDVTAPTVEDVYTFMTEASVVSNQGLLPVAIQPNITVRKAVDGLEIMADKTNVFTDDDITLNISLMSGTEPGSALGNLSVALSDGDAGGTFTPASAMDCE